MILCFISIQSISIEKLSRCYKIYTVLSSFACLKSPNNSHRLCLNNNGNLALLTTPRNKIIWETNTKNKGKAPYRLVIRDDGNAAIYDAEKTKIWENCSQKNGDINNTIEATDDGKVVIKNSAGKVMWTHTDDDDVNNKRSTSPAIRAAPTSVKTNGTCPPAETRDTEGVRYVRLLNSKTVSDRWINFSQLVVRNREMVNIAKGKKATMSSIWPGTNPNNAVDGVESPRPHPINATSLTNRDEWWMVDLGSEQIVRQVIFYNRTDCCAHRIVGAKIQLLDSAKQLIKEYEITTGAMQYCINTI